MPKQVIDAAIKGAHAVFDLTSGLYKKTLEEKGGNTKLVFPETAFYLPLALAYYGLEIKTLSEAESVLNKAKELLPKTKEPGLGDVLTSGFSTLLCAEIIAALQYLSGNDPQVGCEGFLSDSILRSLGLQLVSGKMSGFAVILGLAPDNKTAVEIVRQLQSKNILTFVGGNVDGRSIIDQLNEEKVEMGWDTYIVPYGRETYSAIYVVNWAVRAALTFGGLKAGAGQKIFDYTRERVLAFVLALGKLDEVKIAAAGGAIGMGFPVICDSPVPTISAPGVTKYEALIGQTDYKKIVETCIVTRGIKVKVAHIDIPVLYGPAFEGERVRKPDVHVEFGSKVSVSFELLKSAKFDSIKDGSIELIGPDIDKLPSGAKSLPLAILVEVAGRNMQKDFEPIIERQIHKYINEAMGIMHVGQRDMNWIRISNDAFAKGFRLAHFGKILHAKIHEEYGVIVDKVSVRIYTNKEDVEKLLAEARTIYNERDERLSGMTDESVDEFYSCTLCQSFAPNHVCIVTPERLGLCGGYSWLDTKAQFQVIPTGGNQPIKKEGLIDPKTGEWESINKFVYNSSNKSISNVTMYSLLQNPQSSCGCFECIVAIIPEANGVMVVNRDYAGLTPCGMSFTTLAGSVGGGVQSPGFIGVGKLYVVSKKFISAEGGIKRLVWMPKELKEALAEKLDKRCKEEGFENCLERIADETNAETSEQLLTYLQKVEHPALEMPPLI